MRRRQNFARQSNAIEPVVARDSWGVPVSSHTGVTAPAAAEWPPKQPVADPTALYKWDGVTFTRPETVKGEFEPVQFEPPKRKRGRPPKARAAKAAKRAENV